MPLNKVGSVVFCHAEGRGRYVIAGLLSSNVFEITIDLRKVRNMTKAIIIDAHPGPPT